MSILQRNKKKATAIGIAAAAIAAIAIGGGTYAAFTSTADGPGGTLAAGTLKLDVTSNPTGTTSLFKADNIAPGYVSTVRKLSLTNSGSINGTLTAVISVAPNTGGALQKYLTGSATCTLNGSAAISSGDLPVSTFGGTFTGISIPAGKTLACDVVFKFPDNGGDQNDAQGDKVDISSKFTLKQAS